MPARYNSQLVAILWTVVGVVVGILLGIGVSALGLTPPEYKFARFCFWASAVCLGVTDILWHLETEWRWWFQLPIGIAVCLLILIVLPFGLRYVRNKEARSRPTKDSPKLYDANDNLIDLSLEYITPKTSRRSVRIGYVIIAMVVVGVISATGWTAIRKMLSPPFSVTPGTAWIAPDFGSGIYWLISPRPKRLHPYISLPFTRSRI